MREYSPIHYRAPHTDESHHESDKDRKTPVTPPESKGTPSKSSMSDSISAEIRQSPSSDPRTSSDFDKTLTLKDGRVVKVSVNASGQPIIEQGLEPKSPEEDLDTMISQMAMRELDIQVRTVLKKIGLNPSVYLCYAWTVAGDHFRGDMGDFVNYCVKFYMKFAHGVQPGMIVVGPSLTQFLEGSSDVV